MTFASKEEVKKFIEEGLDNNKGVRLRIRDSMVESLWGICASEEDKAKYDDDNSFNEPIKIYLTNRPLQGGFWGMAIIAMTQGENMPEAEFTFEEDGPQASLLEENDKLYQLLENWR